MTVEELKRKLKNIPDNAEVWADEYKVEDMIAYIDNDGNIYAVELKIQ